MAKKPTGPLYEIRLILGPQFGSPPNSAAPLYKIAVACGVSPNTWARAEVDPSRVMGSKLAKIAAGVRRLGLPITMDHLWGLAPMPPLDPSRQL